jgi:hypothetical protein
VPPENRAPSKLTAPPQNLAPPKLTAPPQNRAPAKLTSPPQNLAPPKLTTAPENSAKLKPTVPPENMAPSKLDPAAGKPRPVEAAAVEDHAGEVEVQALPGHRRILSEMCGDDPDVGVADLTDTAECEPLRCRGLVTRLGLIGNTQIGAQNVDASLPVLLPVVGQARHGMHPGQADCGLVIAELRCDRREPLIERPRPVVRGGGLRYTLPSVGHDQGDKRARSCDRREHQLQHADKIMQRHRRRVRQLRMVK